MKHYFFNFSILFSLMLLMAFSSCEVGLGESVDTERPSVSITYPDENAIIKESFVMSGTCSDETYVQKVTVSIEDKTYEATISEDNSSWSIELNKYDEANAKYPIADGTYTVSVMAIDGAKRESQVASRNYTIDNTVPLLVLENPSTVLTSGETIETAAGGFGTSLKISGTVNDRSVSNTIEGSELVFTVFDKDNKYLGQRSVKNVSSSLSSLVGEYQESSEASLTAVKSTTEKEAIDFYNLIYGSEKSSEKKYYKFKITVSDAARTYKGAGVTKDENERGNVSECYYIKDDFDRNGVAYTTAYEVIEKLRANETLTTSEQEYKQILSDYKYVSDDSQKTDSSEGSAAVGIFYLSPKDNPTYEVSSFDAFDSTLENKWENASISVTGTISLTAKPGLDGLSLDYDSKKTGDEKSFKLYLYKLDKDGNRLESEDKIELENTTWNKIGTTYSGKTTLSSKIVNAGSYYELSLVGKSTNGLSFDNGSVRYCFYVQTGTNPPKLEIDSDCKNLYVSKVNDIKVTGTAKSLTGVDGAKVYVSAYYTSVADDNTKTKYSIAEVEANEDATWALSWANDSTWFTEGEGVYTVTVSARDENNQVSEKEISITLDKTAPTVTVSQVTPIVLETNVKEAKTAIEKGYSNGAINGEVTINGMAQDEYGITSSILKIYAAKFDETSGNVVINETAANTDEGLICTSENPTITKDDKVETVISVPSGAKNSANNFKYTLNTTVLTDDSGIILRFESIDKTGNTGKVDYPVFICQETDIPVLSSSNGDVTATTENDASKNLFGLGSSNFLISVSDDDGIKSVTYTLDSASAVELLKNGNSTTFSSSIKLSSLSSGIHTLSITVTDVNGKTKRFPNDTDTIKIAYDNDVPTLSVTKLGDVTYSQGVIATKEFTLKGTVKDSSGVVTIYSLGSDNTRTKVATISECTTAKEWTQKITNNETDAEITKEYIAVDKFGRETQISVVYKIDNTAPVVTVTGYDLTTPAYLTTTGVGSFTVSINETNNLSKVEYSTDGKEWTDTTKEWKSDGLGVQKNFTATITIPSGCTKIEFRATDEAGNVSVNDTSCSRSVKVLAQPTFGDLTVKCNDTAKTAISNVYYLNASYKITGSVNTEALKTITCSLDGTSKDVTVTDKTFTVECKNGESGTFDFTVTDQAGQTGTKSIQVVYDNTNPVTDVSQVTPLVTSSEIIDVKKALKTYKNGAVNGTITIQGTSSDNDKVSSTILEIYAAKIEDSSIKENGLICSSENPTTTKGGETKTVITVPTTNTANNFKFTVDTTVLTDDSGIILRLKSTDRTGNVTTVDYPVYICQETDLPVISSSNSDVSLTEEKDITVGKNLFGMGSNTFYLNVSDDDGVKSVTYTLDGSTTPVSLLSDGTSTTFDTSIKFTNLTAGVHTLSITVTDVNDKTRTFPNSTDDTIKTIKIAYDNDVPEISVTKLGDVTYTKNCFAKDSFTLAGTVSDSCGVVTIYKVETKDGKRTETPITLTKDSSTTDVSKIENCSSSADWSTTVSDTTDGDKTLTYLAKDKYGREKEITISYKVDKVPPVFNKKYITLIGTVSNASKSYKLDSYTASETSTVWFSGTSFTVKGEASGENLPITEDNLSSIKMYKGSVTGTPIATLEPNGNNTFSGSVDFADSQESSITLILVAEDKAGNKAELTIALNIDTVSPTINSVTLAGADSTNNKLITNANSVTLKLSANDNISGLSKVVISKLGDSTGSETTLSGKSVTDSEITLDVNNWSDGNYTLSVVLYDKAGLSTQTQVKGLVIDRTAPEVTYTSHKNEAIVDKTITLQGSVNEANLSSNASPVLYYRTSAVEATSSSAAVAAGEWTNVSTSDSQSATFTSDTNIWTISNFDTTKLYNDVSGYKYYDFQVRFTDAAGNTTSAEKGNILKLKIDQNNDRPVIKLSSINTDGKTTLNSGTIVGTIEDSDGDVKNFYLKLSKDADFNEVTVTSGSWSYEIPKNGTGDSATVDGNYELYFKVVDSQNTTFETTGDTTDSLTLPYIQYSTNAKVFTPVKFSVDTNAPKITLVDVSFDDGKTYLGTSVGNNQKFGGVTNKTAKFKVTASDTVTTAENLTVKLELGTDTETLTHVTGTTDEFECTVDCSKITKSGIYQLKVTATDEANMSESFTRTVIVDNSAPDTIKNIAPNTSSAVTGEFTFSGLIQDDEDANSGIQQGKIYYYIPKYAERNTDFTSSTFTDNFGWKQENLTATTVSWSIEFKDLAGTLGYNATSGTLSDAYDGFVNGENPDLYNIPVWFKAIDAVGNVGYITKGCYTGYSEKQDILLNFNPNADKPTVEIISPEHDTTVTTASGSVSYTVLGGTIRFAGSASDNEGIDAVYLQFDLDGDGKFENGISDEDTKTMITGCPWSYSDVVLIPAKKENGENAKGIKVQKGTISWSHSIDVSELKGLSYADDGKLLKVRACAVDNDTNGQLASAWSDVVNISVNNSVPQITVEKLRQYDATDTSLSSPIKEVTYSDGDYVSGTDWYLEGTFADSDGIDIENTTAKVNGTAAKAKFTMVSVTEGKKYSFKIPVGSESGSHTIKLSVKDKDSNNPQTTEREYTVKIDNTAPVSEKDASGSLLLYKNEYGSSGNLLDNTSTFIQNSNGTFTLAGKVKEEDSGFSRVAFFFTRTISSDSKTYVYNVKESYGDTRTDNRTEIASSQEDKKVYINSEGLPALYMATVTRTDETSISFDGLGENKNIRKAGLVKIGGSYHKIKAISGNVVTIEGECSTTFTQAEFIYAMVCDNNDNGTGSKDDGDEMAESYSKSGTYYTWDSSIDSTNIPDGPVTVTVVAFDKAGNAAAESLSTRVSNSPVRITSVKLATDLNGNGSFEESEGTTFYAFKNADGTGDTTKGTDIWNLDTQTELYGSSTTGKRWYVKKDLQVTPEFVGGTSPFYWTFAKDTDDKDATTAATPTVNDAYQIANKGSFTLTNDTLNTKTGEGKSVTYQFSFWDSTEELTVGTDTSWTVLNAKVYQELTDSTNPTISIKPFYWESSSKNSLFENSTSNGHIELEADWKGASGYSSTATSGILDGDPKVSGIIKIQGTANDNKILKEIKVQIPGLLDTFTTVGTYTPGAGWNDTKAENVKTTLNATGNAGWVFTVDSEENFQESGHTITWTLTVNTEKITGVAKADVAVQVQATDQSSNSSVTSSTQTTSDAQTSYYKMDVVPYITGVNTYLSTKLKTSIVDAYKRTVLGHYVVSDTETSIPITGFNLGTNTTINASALSTGAHSIKVNGIESINNMNNNNACGSYKNGITEESSYSEKSTYAYNRMPEQKSNQLLTDDLYFDVWQFDSDAAKPVSGKLSQPVMKINPSNGLVNFAFVSGPADFSMGQGTSNSYTRWQNNYATFTNVSMAIDELGNTYGTATGLDTYPSGAINTQAGKFTFFTSKWGISGLGMNGNYNGENAIRLEGIGVPGSNMCYVKGEYPSSYTMTETRFSSPSIATAVHGSSTSVYLAYYDDIQGQIRFRYGSTVPASKGAINDFVDNTGINGGSNYVFEANTTNFSLIAGRDWQNYSTTESSTTGLTYKVGSNYFYDTGYEAGAYVALDAIAGTEAAKDIVVAVFYDGQDCYYAYNTAPTSGKDNGPAAGWTTKKIFSDGGEYCTIKAGPDGSIHIAANVDGALKYAYLSSYDADYTESTDSVTVDSYAITGEQITIDVGRKKNSSGTYVIVPYISYYVSAAKKPAIATLVIPSSGTMNYTAQGTINNIFTGNWEVSIVPTKSDLSGGADDKINVGLWKSTVDSSKGVIVKSTELNSTTSKLNTASTTTGMCYGNGTANAILGYAVKSSSGTNIETAQLK